MINRESPPIQKRKVEESIDTILPESLDSGQPILITPESWEEKKRRLTERAKQIEATKRPSRTYGLESSRPHN